MYTKTHHIFRTVQTVSTPGSARKVIMGLERGLNRVRYVLTPKRRTKNENADPDEPNVLSGKVELASNTNRVEYESRDRVVIANK